MHFSLRTLALLAVGCCAAACRPQAADARAVGGGAAPASGDGGAGNIGGAAGSGSMVSGGSAGELAAGASASTGGTASMVAGASGGNDPITAGASGAQTAGASGQPDAGPASGGAGGTSGTGGTSGSGGDTAGTSSTPAFDPCPSNGECEVLPLGDSITFGSTTNAGGYRVELFARAHADDKHMTFVGSQMNGPPSVAGAPFPPHNEGHPGWTIAQIDGIADVSHALADRPQIVLLHIGTNDMGSMSSGAPERLEELIDKVLTALPDSLVAVSSIIPLPWTDANVRTYNAAIPPIIEAKAAAGKHVIYVEMYRGFPDNGLSGDNIHPDDVVGYPWMGDAWYEAISEYLH